MKNYTEFSNFVAQKESVFGEQSDIYFQQLGEKLRESNNPLNMAKAAFFDIYSEFKHSPSEAQLVWQVVYQGGYPNIPTVDPQKNDMVRIRNRNLFQNLLPSMFENERQRASHGHLVDMVYESGVFLDSAANRNQVADTLYKGFSVIDMGGRQNIVLPTRNLTEHNLTAEDFEENLPLILKFFDKGGSKIMPFPVNEFGDYISEEIGQPELIQKIYNNMRDNVGTSDGASMWTSFRLSEDGKGLEVNVTAGNWDTGAFHEVGVWGYKDKDDNYKPLIIPMEDVMEMVKASKMSHWLDAMNDPWETGEWVGTKRGREWLRDKNLGFLTPESLKEKIGEWYEKGTDYKKEDGTMSKKYWGSKDPGDWLSIPNWAIEVADPRGFEFEHIIVPFWEKYGSKGMDLSDVEFENMWQKLLEDESITFEDRFMKWWIDEYTELIAPPGGFRGRTSVNKKSAFSD